MKRPRQRSIEATAIPRAFPLRDRAEEGTVWDVESTSGHNYWVEWSAKRCIYVQEACTDASCEIGVSPEHRRFNSHLLLLHLI
ncbi:unnamed protein product [Lasius platythorax]|uniref:Uncharacterized protein n=1 Tax=Lasius platythorax TaxID=488582 RepID=A0AAV2NI10_9HYME